MTIMICIGSSCHFKGSRYIITQMEELLRQHQLEDTIHLEGRFCMGRCAEGISVAIEETLFSLTPETVRSFFEKEVLVRAKGAEA